MRLWASRTSRDFVWAAGDDAIFGDVLFGGAGNDTLSGDAAYVDAARHGEDEHWSRARAARILCKTIAQAARRNDETK